MGGPGADGGRSKGDCGIRVSRAQVHDVPFHTGSEGEKGAVHSDKSGRQAFMLLNVVTCRAIGGKSKWQGYLDSLPQVREGHPAAKAANFKHPLVDYAQEGRVGTTAHTEGQKGFE